MVMKETKTLDKEAQKIFVKEVQVLKRLKHPNVLNFMGLLLDKDNQMCFLVGMFIIFHHCFNYFVLFLSIDYIDGGTLKNIIHDSAIPLTWLQRLRYAKDISAGMVKSKIESFSIIHTSFYRNICIHVILFIEI